MVSSLLTLPQLHNHGIRLDWLLRLILSEAQGRRQPTRNQILKALNEGLTRSRVNFLEDPAEDAFCERLPTRMGNFRIFSGQWEGAGPCTQTLLQAFEALPDAEPKTSALASAYSLLRISEALIERSGVSEETESSGTPHHDVSLPPWADMKRQMSRVEFSAQSLLALGVSKTDLASFFLSDGECLAVGDSEIGSTPLEFHPLLDDGDGILVLHPSNISTAIRGLLINTASMYQMGDALRYELMLVQHTYADESGFWPFGKLVLSKPNANLLRASFTQYAHGRYLQVIHIPPDVSDFGNRCLAGAQPLSEAGSNWINKCIKHFWTFLREQGDHRESVTVFLLSTIGNGAHFALDLKQEAAPEQWRYFAVSFADAKTLGGCEDGRFADICRLLEIHDQLEASGFSFLNPNGLLNLFGFWRDTGGTLIPEHAVDMVPPCQVMMPTDALLTPRLEARRRVDARALRLPDGLYKLVQRMNWDEETGLKPIYASSDDALARQLVGAVLVGERTWWLQVLYDDGDDVDWAFRFFDACLKWLHIAGGLAVEEHGAAFPDDVRGVRIQAPRRELEFREYPTRPAEDRIAETVSVSESRIQGWMAVEVHDEWSALLTLVENVAEVELTAGLLGALAATSGETPSRAELRSVVTRAVGTSDWRIVHALRAERIHEQLRGLGLVPAFKPLPLSASALAKCNTVWSFRERAEPKRIGTKDECTYFLQQYHDRLLEALIARVRRYDRQALVAYAAQQYQAARCDIEQWRFTIRALRAIHGELADRVAFERQGAANAVQRGSKALLELAACEARADGGWLVDEVDFQDLCARVLQVALDSELQAAIHAELIPPVLHISPGGDVLAHRDEVSALLKPSAEWLARGSFNRAARAYGLRRERQEEDAAQETDFDPEYVKALTEEYGVGLQALVDIPHLFIQWAEARNQGMFFQLSSELIHHLLATYTISEAQARHVVERMTLPCRPDWQHGRTKADLDFGRFSRRFSPISRPLIAIDSGTDPVVAVAPLLVADALRYCVGALHEGHINNNFWEAETARRYAGHRGRVTGEEFESAVAERVRERGLYAQARCKLGWLLNQKVPPELGDIDVVIVSPKGARVWIVEAKNLRLCRTQAEIATRMAEYRGVEHVSSKGKRVPDKLLRHLRRVEFVRQRASAVAQRLKLNAAPDIRGLLVVDAPQPMNFHAANQHVDGRSIMIEEIHGFNF